MFFDRVFLTGSGSYFGFRVRIGFGSCFGYEIFEPETFGFGFGSEKCDPKISGSGRVRVPTKNPKPEPTRTFCHNEHENIKKENKVLTKLATTVMLQ